jgi:hypothetical protein
MVHVSSTEGGPIPALHHQRLCKLKDAFSLSVTELFRQLSESKISTIKRPSSGEKYAILTASFYQGHFLVLVPQHQTIRSVKIEGHLNMFETMLFATNIFSNFNQLTNLLNRVFFAI